jgi:curved DNA-binding protein CbpA
VNYREALRILELDENNESRKILKEQYQWLVWFYHPDNLSTGNREEFQKVIEAYQIVSSVWKVA